MLALGPMTAFAAACAAIGLLLWLLFRAIRGLRRDYWRFLSAADIARQKGERARLHVIHEYGMGNVRISETKPQP